MEKTKHVLAPAIEKAEVLPRTLVLKIMPIPGGEAVGVYGSRSIREGAEADVWVASFFDENEAKAWVLGNRNFGAPILGGVLATRSSSGETPEESGGEAGGSVREACEPGTPRGPGSTDQLPERLPLSSRDEVGGGCAGP